MSYPYPQDRRREQREKGEQPYEDAREAFAENEAELRRQPGAHHEERARRSKEDQEHDAEERFEHIAEETASERDRRRH
jgi:hypothetical protein